MRYVLAAVLVCLTGCSQGSASDAGTDASVTVATDATDARVVTPGADVVTADAVSFGSLVPCDPFATSGGACATGEQCTRVFDVDGDGGTTSQTRCVRIAMPSRAGQTCNSLTLAGTVRNPTRTADPCVTGQICFVTGGGSQGHCGALCTTAHAMCTTGDACFDLGIDGATGVCNTDPTAACDPIAQTGCGAGQGCYLLYRLDGAPTTYCSNPPDAPDLVAENAVCTNGGCDIGFTCAAEIAPATGRRCRRVCDPNGGGDAGTGCTNASAPTCTMVATSGTSHPVGVCR